MKFNFRALLYLGLLGIAGLWGFWVWIQQGPHQAYLPEANRTESSNQSSPIKPLPPPVPLKETDEEVAKTKLETSATPACYEVTFRHQPMPGNPAHADEEACSHHRNLIRLGHKIPTNSGLCIRVNGTPVKFQKSKEDSTHKEDAFIIAPIAGPRSVITAEFCLGKTSCAKIAKNCKIPRDEFLDALGGSEADAAEAVAGAGRWEDSPPNDVKDQDLNERVETEVKRTLAESNDGAAEDGTYLFKQWIGQERVSLGSGCETGMTK